MTAPSLHTDLLAYNFNLGTTNFTANLARDTAESTLPLIGKSFMHELAREGDVLSAEVVMEKGGEIDAPDDEGRRPLHEAAFCGKLDMVQFLVSSGAIKDAPVHPFGYTALWFAVVKGHHDVARYLLEKGANVNVSDALNGQTLLHVTALRGDMKMTGMLIAAGINTLAEDKQGKTARDFASRGNHRQLESVLLKVMEHHARFAA
ncbi:MAG TPA: ankyrin repeat domain-containing protein [Patescibacteria group bacterium]|nr:ankyrin repeat domain-containing protein [Patescibacteria group bacterium]